MSLITSSCAISIVEWSGVAASLTGSVLNAHGRRSSFMFWTLSALLLGMVAWYLGRSGWLALQGAGIGINLYGMRNWQGNAPTRTVNQGS
jgi:hypothetical protein